MADLATTFLAAEEAAVFASTDLLAALGGPQIYTAVPENAVPPYVVIGQHQVLETEGDDDCGGEGEVFASIDVWTRPAALTESAAEAREILGLIKPLVRTAFALTGHTVDLWAPVSETYVTDPDGSTHGRIETRYETTQSGA